MNRDAMFGAHLAVGWKVIAGVTFLYALVIVWAGMEALGMGAARGMGRVLRRIAHHPVFLMVVVFAGVALGAVGFRGGPPRPENAYVYRLINLFIPLLFAAAAGGALIRGRLASPGGEGGRVEGRRGRLLRVGVAVLLMVAAVTQVGQTRLWRRYLGNFTRESAARHGFVAVEAVPPLRDDPLMWSWTGPSLSLVLALRDGRPLQTVFYNPHAPYQPYGPAEADRLRSVARRYGVSVQ